MEQPRSICVGQSEAAGASRGAREPRRGRAGRCARRARGPGRSTRTGCGRRRPADGRRSPDRPYRRLHHQDPPSRRGPEPLSHRGLRFQAIPPPASLGPSLAHLAPVPPSEAEPGRWCRPAIGLSRSGVVTWASSAVSFKGHVRSVSRSCPLRRPTRHSEGSLLETGVCQVLLAQRGEVGGECEEQPTGKGQRGSGAEEVGHVWVFPGWVVMGRRRWASSNRARSARRTAMSAASAAAASSMYITTIW